VADISNKPLSKADFDRAFDEVVFVLYKQYRKKKKAQKPKTKDNLDK